MITDTTERWWRRAIVATLVCTVASFVLMAITGHEQGFHDNAFGLTLFVLLFLGGATFTFLFSLYVLYALTIRIFRR